MRNYFYIDEANNTEVSSLAYEIEKCLEDEFDYKELNIILEIKVGVGENERTVVIEEYLDDDFYEENDDYSDKIDEILFEVEREIQRD